MRRFPQSDSEHHEPGGHLIRWLVLAVATLAGLGVAVGPGIGAASSSAPTLTVDPTFGGGHEVSLSFPSPPGCASTSFTGIGGIAKQSDGKFVVDGFVEGFNCGVNPDHAIDVARLTSTGGLDSTFGSGGYAQLVPTTSTVNYTAATVGIEPDNQKIVIGGSEQSGSSEYPLLARLNTDGSADSTFGTSGVFVDTSSNPDSVSTLAFDSSNRILAAGDGGDLRRYSGNAPTLDWHSPSFLVGGNGSPGATGIIPQDDGNILVAGTSYTTTTHKDFGILARVTSTGTMDPSFGAGGCPNVSSGCTNITPANPSGIGEIVTSLDLQGSNILLGGVAQDSGSLIARLTPAGQLDTSFGSGGKLDIPPPSGYSDTRVNRVLFDPYPGIITIGGGTQFNSTETQSALSFAPDGTFSGTVSLPNGSMVSATGTFTQAGQTIEFLGADGNGNPVVGQIDASEGTGGTGTGTGTQTGTTATTTTTTQPCPSSNPPPECKFDLAPDIQSISSEGQIDWIDWQTKHGFVLSGNRLQFKTGGWYALVAKVAVSNFSQNVSSPFIPTADQGHDLFIIPNRQLQSAGETELTQLGQLQDVNATGGPKCQLYSFETGRPTTLQSHLDPPNEWSCAIRSLAPLQTTKPLNVSWVSASGIGEFAADTRSVDCRRLNDERDCGNNFNYQAYNFVPPSTELREPELGAYSTIISWLYARAADRNFIARAIGQVASAPMVQFALTTLRSNGGRPSCAWLSAASGRLVVNPPVESLFTVLSRGALCTDPIWINATPGRISGHKKLWMIRVRNRLPSAPYVLLARVVSRDQRTGQTLIGMPVSASVSQTACLRNGLCRR